jgi:hypothetical protein
MLSLVRTPGQTWVTEHQNSHPQIILYTRPPNSWITGAHHNSQPVGWTLSWNRGHTTLHQNTSGKYPNVLHWEKHSEKQLTLLDFRFSQHRLLWWTQCSLKNPASYLATLQQWRQTQHNLLKHQVFSDLHSTITQKPFLFYQNVSMLGSALYCGFTELWCPLPLSNKWSTQQCLSKPTMGITKSWCTTQCILPAPLMCAICPCTAGVEQLVCFEMLQLCNWEKPCYQESTKGHCSTMVMYGQWGDNHHVSQTSGTY